MRWLDNKAQHLLHCESAAEHVTKASGTTLATLQGQELSVEAVDGAPDALSPDGGFLTTAPCNFDSESVTPILHGNIDVHDN